MVVATGFPNCCGATVIYGMSTDLSVPANRTSLIELIQSGKNTMQLIILSDPQTQQYPDLLTALAATGFAYVGRSNNYLHNSWCNLFIRCHLNGVAYRKPPFNYPGHTAIDWVDTSAGQPALLVGVQPNVKTPAKPVVPDPFAPRVPVAAMPPLLYYYPDEPRP